MKRKQGHSSKGLRGRSSVRGLAAGAAQAAQNLLRRRHQMASLLVAAGGHRGWRASLLEGTAAGGHRDWRAGSGYVGCSGNGHGIRRCDAGWRGWLGYGSSVEPPHPLSTANERRASGQRALHAPQLPICVVQN
eukprot:CAMPEP_0119380308 /NCGR_PEP_ID=MMETSP1334-20130426/56345_1 /TAXON_ID=127549 /ORGANISM="Calcidiscus leptoporus, Strain RCC1130" /LENGTH=133 /DNA_ID=CAMNT_0007400081 /DNA_START=437 /DNA_END=837 /DNA_ORIENTATION=+